MHKYPEWVQEIFRDSSNHNIKIDHANSTARQNATPSKSSSSSLSHYHRQRTLDVSSRIETSQTATVKVGARLSQIKLGK
uniref:Bm8442 n=1 Tax=Brugia malayi TaxID=6279 RepID=A0A0H5S1H9_BRUMA|nr:Bm8442 [Brugia malayi]